MTQELPSAIATEGWSADELESVAQCPLCNSSNRSTLYAAIRDRLFHTPGTWTLYECQQCGIAYLDPRPTPAAIGKTYATYFTHAAEAVAPSDTNPRSFKEWLKCALKNGYINRQYHVQKKPALFLGTVFGSHLNPVEQSRIAGTFRRLQLPSAGGVLLDVGCGNGAFLRQMRDLGWSVMGIDFDPQAVDACKQAGIPALQGALEAAGLAPASFDAITLSHVIEHLYHPLETLKYCHTLLKPGGQFYVETPNLRSRGHANFQEHWRGLEPPRHLMLFHPAILQQVCEQAGFEVEGVYGVVATFLINQHSMAIRDGRDPYSAEGWVEIPETLAQQWVEEERLSVLQPQQADIIALVARKNR